MRYLSLLAVILASTPVCAVEFTNRIELLPGDAEQWQAPRPFSEVHVGNPDVVNAIPGKTNQELIITMKPGGGTTNILLTGEDGKLVANVLVTNPAAPPQSGPQLQVERSPGTGEWRVYVDEDKCWPDCYRNNPLTKPTRAQPATTPSSPRPEEGSDSSNVIPPSAP
jgi:Flp pilus assembly secretin CpaC